MITTENTKTCEGANKLSSPITVEHRRRVLAAITDYGKGQKDIPRRRVAFQLGLFNDGDATPRIKYL